MLPPEKRDQATLADLVRAAQLILEFTAGIDEQSFLRDVKTQSAVLHQILIIGEAVKRLYRVDLSEVWKTARLDLPVLLSQLTRLQADTP